MAIGHLDPVRAAEEEVAVTQDGVDVMAAYPRELGSLGAGTDELLGKRGKTTKTGTSPITS